MCRIEGWSIRALSSTSEDAEDAVQQALLGSREQYFIRVTSSEPPETLWSDPGFLEVMRGLEQLGLTVQPARKSRNL